MRESHVAIVFGSAARPHAMKPGKWAAQGTFKAVAPLGQQPRASTVVSGNNMVGALGNNMIGSHNLIELYCHYLTRRKVIKVDFNS